MPSYKEGFYSVLLPKFQEYVDTDRRKLLLGIVVNGGAIYVSSNQIKLNTYVLNKLLYFSAQSNDVV